MELAPGTLLQTGKYKIIGKLGQGGFGIAYRAHHQSLQRDVCIKEFFYSDLCERAQNSLDVTIITKSTEKLNLVNSLKKKFTKEAQRLAKFQHTNIVQVTDTFEENNTAYFVMEYLQGGSLEDLLSREGVLSEQKTKELILPLIDALDAIHKTDLLHLDIKPANIMLRNHQTPVLIDFGISKYMELTGGVTTTSPVGISKGYAPLEQYGGSISDFSKATDVYSLCATIYKMITGHTPLEPLQILSVGLKSPSDYNSSVSKGLSSLMLKGLSVKKIDRPQNMSEVKTYFEPVIIIQPPVIIKNDPLIIKNYGTAFDVDDNVYTTMKIGTQEWMVQDLRTKRYKNGDKINTSFSSTKKYAGEVNPKYQWNSGLFSNSEYFGRLYTWHVISDSRGIAPKGWKVPSIEDWRCLFDFLIKNGFGSNGSNSGFKLFNSLAKPTGWDNISPTNTTGFSALPGGHNTGLGFVLPRGTSGCWWSSTEYDSSSVYNISLSEGFEEVFIHHEVKYFAMSIRCIKES